MADPIPPELDAYLKRPDPSFAWSEKKEGWGSLHLRMTSQTWRNVRWTHDIVVCLSEEQPNSLYSAIGVENGDVIQRINGYEMNSPDKALEVYQKLRESPHITLEIERNGTIIRKEYNVTGS